LPPADYNICKGVENPGGELRKLAEQTVFPGGRHIPDATSIIIGTLR